MIVVHVLVSTVEDYLARREPHRQAHFERLLRLRARGGLLAGGPSPDGRSADLIYRLAEPAELRPLVEEDPYFEGGVWTGYRPRSFERFVEPWELPPVVLDGSRRATIVEGPAADPELAQLALVQLRGQGRLALGGTFGDGDTLALVRSADPGEAAGWLAATGAWPAESLRARPYVYAL
jgi:uncharacterized protein YciI